MRPQRKKRDPDRLIRRLSGLLAAHQAGDYGDRQVIALVKKIVREERYELAQV